MQLEEKIISNLMFNEEFANKVIPFAKKEYFGVENGFIVDEIVSFYKEYGKVPSKDEIKIDLSNNRTISDKILKKIYETVDKIDVDVSDPEWLVKNTEKMFKDKALVNAIMQGATILEQGGKDNSKILGLVEDALSVTFDTNIGHDYFSDIQKRFESYHTVEDKVSWGLTTMNNITNGGISKKNIACAVAPTGSGKTAFLCSIVSNAIRHGYNVLYISMEMSEQKIAERIDANLMNETIPNIYKMNLNQYTSKVNQLKERVKGTLKIKEYPTSGANVSHFKALMNELKLKQHFVPDLVVVDYLNICNSARVKAGQTNSYGYIKAISEELRGLAVEYNVALLTATQTNRNGFNNSDVEMTDISESIGMTHVMDFIFAIIRTEALDQVHQISIKQLKNRYSDPNQNSTVFLGIDFSRMKLYDLEGSANGTNAEFFRPEYRPVEKTAPMSYKAPSPMTQINDFSSFQF